MNRSIRFTGIVLLVLVLTVFARQIPTQVQARQEASLSGTAERWSSGVMVDGPLEYAAIAGRMVTNAAAFRADPAVPDKYFVFPAPAVQRTLESAKFQIIERSETVSGFPQMQLGIYKLDGSLVQMISTTVDLATAETDAWLDFQLVESTSGILLLPGQFLAVHYTGGDTTFSVYPIFDIELR
ncbi:MAG: hypothetical protein CVU39_04600 [Chloroflexi bacterium HGW-Chloroflexi-10]|nr:MAG: hypothetical protein CVU39_04600 [Chloroflexi bacterium HGW-Chloroflexi-10]